MKHKILYIVLIAFISTAYTVQSSGKSAINWGQLSPQTFEQAKKENKIIVLNLRANWCHWCHVMEDSTYANAESRCLFEQALHSRRGRPRRKP